MTDQSPMRHRLPSTALLVAALLFAGCQKQSEQPVENQQQADAPQPAPPPPVVAPEKPRAATPKVDRPKVKAPPKPSADEQMTDDADATGMTSHTTPDADTTQPAGGNSQ